MPTGLSTVKAARNMARQARAALRAAEQRVTDMVNSTDGIVCLPPTLPVQAIKIDRTQEKRNSR